MASQILLYGKKTRNEGEGKVRKLEETENKQEEVNEQALQLEIEVVNSDQQSDINPMISTSLEAF